MSASAPQLPLLIEDALRSEDVEGTEADGTQRVRVNQVKLSTLELVYSTLTVKLCHNELYGITKLCLL